MKVNGVQNNNFHCIARKTHNFLNIFFCVWYDMKASKLVFNLSHHTAPPAPPSPCGSNEQQRRSVWRSVWSPFRWAFGARWCNRTARPYWHIPSRSQSYPYSRTLWIEANTTVVDYITQHYCIIGICVLMHISIISGSLAKSLCHWLFTVWLELSLGRCQYVGVKIASESGFSQGHGD